MEYAAKRNQKGAFEGFYRLIMRRNSVYVTFIIAGAFFGERAVDYGVHKLWESNNIGAYFYKCFYYVQDPLPLLSYGNTWVVKFVVLASFFSIGMLLYYYLSMKRYEDISVLGQRPAEE